MSKSAKDYAEQCLGLHIPMTALTDTVAIFHDVPVFARAWVIHPPFRWITRWTSSTASSRWMPATS